MSLERRERAGARTLIAHRDAVLISISEDPDVRPVSGLSSERYALGDIAFPCSDRCDRTQWLETNFRISIGLDYRCGGSAGMDPEVGSEPASRSPELRIKQLRLT